MINQPIPIPTKKLLKTNYAVLIAITVAHFINDLMQAVVPSIYPQLVRQYGLTLTQVGIITLCGQMSAAIFQPMVGTYTDKKPQPYSQFYGMILSSFGIIVLAFADSFYGFIIAVVLIGIGASIFHPESSRVANLSSGGKLNFAQSIFQLGGYGGIACAPILVVLLVLNKEQYYILGFLLLTFVGKILLLYVGKWRKNQLRLGYSTSSKLIRKYQIGRNRTRRIVLILLVLIFSKYFYSAGMTNFFQFYVIETFNTSEEQAQIFLFYFLIATAAATLIGGIMADHLGKLFIIRLSVFGSIPLALMLPYASSSITAILVIFLGLFISLSFSAILVFAQELLPHKIGAISGMFYGFAMGMSGLGAAFLGFVADYTGVAFIYMFISFLPLLGLVILFFPAIDKESV